MTSLPFALHAATARPRHGSSQAFITLTRRPLSVSRALHVLGSCVLCLAPPAVDLLEALGRCVCTRRAWCQPPRFNVVQVLCTPCSTPPPAEVLNMCNTTSEQGVEHPRGPHRVQHVQHVQHLFNTCLFQVLNNRKRDFCRRGRIGCHIQASMVHQCAFGLQYVSPLRKKYVSTSIRT